MKQKSVNGGISNTIILPKIQPGYKLQAHDNHIFAQINKFDDILTTYISKWLMCFKSYDEKYLWYEP